MDTVLLMIHFIKCVRLVGMHYIFIIRISIPKADCVSHRFDLFKFNLCVDEP